MPASEGIAKLSGAEQKRLGLPEDFKVYSAQPFGSMNQQDARTALDDTEFYWIENYLLVGKSKLRALWDHGTALYTAPAGLTIVYFCWFNINSSVNCAVFLSDGTAVQVAYPSGTVTPITTAAGTFYEESFGQLPMGCQWGTLFLLIVNNFTPNSYWVWDGMVLYSAGSLGPYVIGDITAAGSQYTSAPTVTVYGGSGSGATVTAYVNDGSVTSLTVTNPGSGYNPADAVALAFSGGGSDGGAVLQAILSSSGVAEAVITNPGAGYTSAPVVTFSGGGGQFAGGLAAINTAGQVTGINVNVSGTGYTSPPDITFTGGGGSGAAATSVLAISGVESIQVVTAGSGYTGVPTVGITGGGGTGATAIATVTGGAVTAITVTNAGTGYTGTPTVAITGGSGSGATAVATLTVASISSVDVINGGSGYSGTPTLTFVGGGGTGATATATVTGGVITLVTPVTAGSGYVSPPAVLVEGGLNNSANASIALMPFGVSGNALETFNSRVWIAQPANVGPIDNSGVFNVSAPASFTDFSTSDGGLLFTNSDRFLRDQYNSIHQSNGYLYTLGDSSVSVISNVQTSGTPTSTTFNYQNTSPQAGTPWRDSVQDFGQSVIFSNANGIQGLYGGAVQKLSKKMDNLFDKLVQPATSDFVPPSPTTAVMPSAAVANLFTIPTYMLNCTIISPLDQTQRTLLIMWDEKNWYVGSQSVVMSFIGTQEIDSVNTAWGTDGMGLYPMFTTPSAALKKLLVTKMVGGERDFIVKEPLAIYIRGTDETAAQTGVAMAVTFETTGIAQQIGAPPSQLPAQSYPMLVQPNFVAPLASQDVWAGATSAVAGTALGIMISSTSPDYFISGVSMAYRDVAPLYG